MSTTAEIIAKLEAEAFDAEEMARVWGGESQCAPPLRAAAARLDELERENAALRKALKPFAWLTRVSSLTEEKMIRAARAALAGSGEK